MKICRVCIKNKVLSDFYPKKDAKDGYMSICKPCNKDALLMWAKNNPKKVRLQRQRHDKKRYSTPKRKLQIIQNASKRKQLNPKKFKLSRRKASSKYRKNNLSKHAAKENKRRADKLNRTPKWLKPLDFTHIEMFYKAAADLTKELGIKFEVDHIIPLKGKLISGLHVPSNLQLLPKSINASKGNRVTL